MTARWQKNASLPAQRTCSLLVYEGGVLCDPSKDFIALGWLFVVGANTPKPDLATGTCTNQRRPLVVADDVIEAVDVVLDQVTMTGHLYQTGDGPFDSDEVMGPIAIGGDIYAIRVDANTVAWASSLANAYAGTRIALAGTEVGATISDNASTERAMRGHFVYVAPVGEVNHNYTEMLVIVDGPVGSGYERANQDGGYTTIMMGSDLATWEADDGSGTGRTMGDLMRGTARTAMAPIIIDPVTGEYVVRNLDDTTDSHGGRISATGRDDVDLSGLA